MLPWNNLISPYSYDAEQLAKGWLGGRWTALQIFVKFSSPWATNNAARRICSKRLGLYRWWLIGQGASYADARLISISWLRVNENRKSNQLCSPHNASYWLAVHLSSVQGRFVSREHVSKLSEPFIGDKNMCRYSETLKKLLDFRQKEEALV